MQKVIANEEGKDESLLLINELDEIIQIMCRLEG
jgi:hypothetical protein